MKKIMCISWCNADNVINYGQILQACSMMYLLRNRFDGKIEYVSYFPRKPHQIAKKFVYQHNLMNGHLRAYIQTSKFVKEFIKENDVSFYQVYNSKKVESLSKDCDILICGSDQIWHPCNYDKVFFLDFGNPDALRFSYAASLPKDHKEEKFGAFYNTMTELLKNFTDVSIREEQSVDFISSLYGKNVKHVLDPTLLVPPEKWNSMVKPVSVPDEYVFVYIPNGMDQKIASYISELQKSKGIKNACALITRGKNVLKDINVLSFVDLGQFLHLIKKSSYVVTTSFHAAVFSTIFNKQFVCYDVQNNSRGQDLRLYDFLKITGLEKQMLSTNNNALLTDTIDYSEVEKKLEKYREKSNKFLDDIFSFDSQ